MAILKMKRLKATSAIKEFLQDYDIDVKLAVLDKEALIKGKSRITLGNIVLLFPWEIKLLPKSIYFNKLH